MARARNIKPSFFTNDKLAECLPLARLLFAGMWTVADRQGRLEDRPKKIKAEVLPYDDCDADSLLNQLVSGGFIIRYQVDNANYLQIVNFVKHQNPHVKEAESTIPAPDSPGASPVQNVPLPLSPIPYPPSPIPHTSSPIPQTSHQREVRARASPKGYSENFEEFWKEYPRHDCSKLEASKSYTKAISEGETHERLIEGVRAFKGHVERNGIGSRFVAHAATWINQRRWESDYGDRPYADIEQPRKSRWDAAAERIAAKYEPGAQRERDAASIEGAREIVHYPKSIWEDGCGA